MITGNKDLEIKNLGLRPRFFISVFISCNHSGIGLYSIHIDRPSDFRSRSLNRCLAASCFVVSAHSVRWIDTRHDACGSCRPKVCLCEVVELQKQEKIHARNVWGLVPRRQGRSEVKQFLWLVLNIKPKLARARTGSYPLSLNS